MKYWEQSAFHGLDFSQHLGWVDLEEIVKELVASSMPILRPTESKSSSELSKTRFIFIEFEIWSPEIYSWIGLM